MNVLPSSADTGSPYSVLIANNVLCLHATDQGERFVAVGSNHESREPTLGVGSHPLGNETRWVVPFDTGRVGWVGYDSSSQGGGNP